MGSIRYEAKVVGEKVFEVQEFETVKDSSKKDVEICGKTYKIQLEVAKDRCVAAKIAADNADRLCRALLVAATAAKKQAAEDLEKETAGE